MEQRDGCHRPPVLQVSGLLTFLEVGTVPAQIDLSITHGQVHGLSGERAATSAVVHLLAGDAVSDDVRIEIDGRKRTFNHPAGAQQSGVWTVRELVDLHPAGTIAESIAATHGSRRPVEVAPRRHIGAFLGGLGLSHLEPASTVGQLAVADQRLVEIARAAYHGARVIVLDRLGGGWTARDAEPLHEVLGRLVGRGVALLYMTAHRQEIDDLCDSFTVLGAAAGWRPIPALLRSSPV